jgi:hypothetical protein
LQAVELIDRLGVDEGAEEGNGVEWVDWRGMEWSGWIGGEWSGVEWSGLEWSGVDWSGLDWTGLDWTGLDWSAIQSRWWWRVGELTVLYILVNAHLVELFQAAKR